LYYYLHSNFDGAIGQIKYLSLLAGKHGKVPYVAKTYSCLAPLRLFDSSNRGKMFFKSCSRHAGNLQSELRETSLNGNLAGIVTTSEM
jgi:hypothetical protein